MPLEEVYSIEGFIAWLEKQPRDIHYDWFNTYECIARQYLTARGINKLANLAGVFSSLKIYQKVCGKYPWTFGDALRRAKKIKANEQQ